MYVIKEILSLQRHVIAHNRGIADKKYLTETKADMQEGEQLTIGSQELGDYLILISKAGKALLTEAGRAIYSLKREPTCPQMS